MTTQSLTPMHDESGAERRDEVRLKPELRSEEPFGLLGGHELHDMTDIVSRVADTIAAMAQRNAAIEAEASQRMDEMAAEFQGRVADLQDKLNACRAELEAKTREADIARQWLDYLAAGIMDSLSDAPMRLDALARETLPFVRELDAVEIPSRDGPHQGSGEFML